MTITEITEGIRSHAGQISPFGKTIKFEFEEGVVVVDGTGEATTVDNQDRDTDTTITTKLEHFDKLRKGELNPMMAMMSGKLKVTGDMGLAMKLKDIMG
ncbi:MAG: putative sterol carrier protein [Limisphaerales bacterium]|jgi:putative sterol carrier protein